MMDEMQFLEAMFRRLCEAKSARNAAKQRSDKKKMSAEYETADAWACAMEYAIRDYLALRTTTAA
jgi:hypothetical protein